MHPLKEPVVCVGVEVQYKGGALVDLVVLVRRADPKARARVFRERGAKLAVPLRLHAVHVLQTDVLPGHAHQLVARVALVSKVAVDPVSENDGFFVEGRDAGLGRGADLVDDGI